MKHYWYSWIQFVSLFDNGRYLSYVQNRNEIVIHSRAKKQTNTYRIDPTKHISDMTVQLWKEKPHFLYSYYDSKKFQYCVGDSTKTYACIDSPILRCFYFLVEGNLIGEAFGMGGERIKLNVPDADATTTTTCQQLPFQIRLVEYYEPYTYVVDDKNHVQILSPIVGTVLATKKNDFESLIRHFSIHTHYGYASFLLQNKTLVISNWDNQESETLFSPLCISLPCQGIKVHCDRNRCAVALENSCIYIFNRHDGSLLHHVCGVFEPSEITKLFLLPKAVLLDGQAKKPLLLPIESYTDMVIPKDIQEYTQWLTTTTTITENENGLPTKPPQTFLSALLETPPYRFRVASKDNEDNRTSHHPFLNK